MADKTETYHLNLRLRLDRETDMRAWEIIQHNKGKFRSANEFLVHVICQYGSTGVALDLPGAEQAEKLADRIAEQVAARLNAGLNAGPEPQPDQTDETALNEVAPAGGGSDESNSGDLMSGGNTEETEDEFELDSAAMDFLDSLS